MTTFALIHGASDSGWYWHLVEPALRERGYDVVLVLVAAMIPGRLLNRGGSGC